MYKNILIPVVLDELHDTQASFLVAKTLANKDATFTVLHVVEDIPAYVSHQIPAEIITETRAQIERELKAMAMGLTGSVPKLSTAA